LVKVDPPSVEIDTPPLEKSEVAAYTLWPSAEAYTPTTLLLPRPVV
jgi:hypothetical protein